KNHLRTRPEGLNGFLPLGVKIGPCWGDSLAVRTRGALNYLHTLAPDWIPVAEFVLVFAQDLLLEGVAQTGRALQHLVLGEARPERPPELLIQDPQRPVLAFAGRHQIRRRKDQRPATVGGVKQKHVVPSMPYRSMQRAMQ